MLSNWSCEMSLLGYVLLLTAVLCCSAAPAPDGIGAQCGPPPVVQYGDTISFNKPLYNSGESVEYKCPEFYRLQGNRIVRCLNGVWDEAPVCLEPCTAKVKDMQDNNIRLKYRRDTKLYSQHGDSMDFTCLSGYEAPPGTQMRITCEHGKLQYPKCFKTGYCVLDQSTMITHNIHYTTSTIVDNGQTITFQCHEEMNPENKLEAKCESGRINYPKCTEKICKTPEILNGFLKTEPKASYDSGSYVQFECNKDYVTNGPINVHCENGQWTELPVCYSPCKISTEDLDLYNIQLLPSDNSGNDPDITHRHGTQLRVICKSGFRRPNQAALAIECSNGRFRYPRCFSGSTCRIDQDELDRNNLELDEVYDNEVFYEENERVHFQCKSGYYRRTKPIGKCSKETLIYPSCTEPCTANVKDMQDNNIRIKYRPDPKLYTQHGDTMDFTCLSGYIAPPGTQMRITCQQGKLQYPKCFKTGFCVLDEPTMITHNIHYTASTIVDNGQTITFQCHEEMNPEDKLEAKCVSGRINYPKCIAGSPCRISTEDLDLYNIQLIPSDNSGNDPDITHRHGTQLRVTCKSGFRRPNQAALAIECSNGKFRYPRCFAGSTCRIDQDELDRNNLELDEVHDKEVFYKENERVHFTCKTGYYRRTKPIGKCSKETLIYPSCTA